MEPRPGWFSEALCPVQEARRDRGILGFPTDVIAGGPVVASPETWPPALPAHKRSPLQAGLNGSGSLCRHSHVPLSEGSTDV